MGLEGLDRAAKLALRKWDAPDDYDSSEETDEEDHVGMKAVLATGDDDDNEMLVEKKDKKEKTLERERFVAWSRRLLAPGCRPPAVLDALRRLAKAASNNDRHALGLPPESQAEADAQEAHAQMLIDQERAADFAEKLINAEDLPTTIPEPLFEGDDDASTAELLDPIAAAFAEAAAEVAANKPPPDPMAGLDVPPPTPPHPEDEAANNAVDAALEAEGVLAARANAACLECMAKLFDEYLEEAVADECVDRCVMDLVDEFCETVIQEKIAQGVLDDAADRAVECARLASEAASEASRRA